MQIVVNLQQIASSVGNYSGLIAAIIDTLKDESLEDSIPNWVRYAEARFNRLIYPIDDETTVALSATVANEGKIDLPDDFKKLRTLTYNAGSGPVVLKGLSPDDFNKRFLDATAAEPEAYSIVNNQIFIGPVPADTYALSLIYVEGIPNLSQAVQTNWLIEAHPDLYFFGVLQYAEMDGWNDERMVRFDGAVDRIIDEIKFSDAQRRSGSVDDVPGSYF